MTDYLHALPSGYRIEEYELVRVLGSGGFGITYLGYDHHLDKAVAIKEYLPNDLAVRTDNQSVLPKSTQDQADYEWGLARFLNEAQTLARFDHRHIIKIHRFFRAHGTGYSVMEYAEGETLSEVLQRKGTLTEAELKQVLFPILDGLEAVHEADFLHRDIKPGNIVIRDNGSLVLIDFGSARQAVAGKSRSVTAIVTPGYAPIEQYSAKGHQGPWTDIYGLGAVCYRCLTGAQPDDATERLREDPLIPAGKRCKGKASAPLLGAIDRALRVDEGERPQTIAEWREVLVDGGESRKRATKPVTRSAESSATAHTGMSWSSMTLVAVIVVLLGASAWRGWQLYREMPGHGVGETAAVVEQPADTRSGSQADVESDTQEGNEVEAAPGTDGMGTGQPAVEPGVLPPAEEEDEVSRLLAAAERDLAARRLTSPVGNNALEKYQRVLELEPVNQDAITGLQRVIESYGELFDAAIEREDFDKAAGYLAKIRNLGPNSPVLEEGERRLEAARQARAERLAELEPQAEEAARQAELERQRIQQEQAVKGHWEAFESALRSEDTDEAAASLAQIRGLNPDAPGLAEGEQRLEADKQAHAERLAELERQRQAEEAAGEMVSIRDGTFRMGDLNSGGDDDERPVHSVTVAAFKLGKYEVTFAQWDACVADGGCNGYRPDDASWGRGNRPVIRVSWDDAQAFIDWLNGKTDRNYRLPTEAEWEYAARAGSSMKYHFGDTESQLCRYANHADISTNYDWKNTTCSDGVGEMTAEVGRYQPNSYGLYDMHGNVYEWVQDCWNDSYEGAPSDGSAWESGDCGRRVVRGGSWYFHPWVLRSARRDGLTRTGRRLVLGFRLATDTPSTTRKSPSRPSILTGSQEEYFTRDSHEDDVLRLQGTPSSISRLSSYEIWMFGGSYVEIDLQTRRVMEWSNIDDNLKVRLLPGKQVTSETYFTRGSHEDDVLRLQGTPSSISRLSSYEIWMFGGSYVEIDLQTRRVMEWSNIDDNLKVRLLPGKQVTSETYFTRGSHEDDVLRLQGTPSSISRLSSYEIWMFGGSYVEIDLQTRRVMEWSNIDDNLKVKL